MGDIEGESCGWPKGTVRATIALITIPLAFMSAAGVIGVLLWKEQYTAATGIIGTSFGIVGTIIGHYFGSKQANDAAQMISENEHELIESRNRELKYGYRQMRYQDGLRNREDGIIREDIREDVRIDMEDGNSDSEIVMS